MLTTTLPRNVGTLRIERVEIYSLDGMVATEGVTAWLDAAPPVDPEDIPDDPTSSILVRSFIQSLDQRLDALR